MLTRTGWLNNETGPHSLPSWYATLLAACKSPHPTLPTLLDGSLAETRDGQKALRSPGPGAASAWAEVLRGWDALTRLPSSPPLGYGL